MTDWVGYGYAALIASGGAMGYVKAGNCIIVPSGFTQLYSYAAIYR